MKKWLFLIIGLLFLPFLARADKSDGPYSEDLAAEEAEGESLFDQQAGASAKTDDFTLSGYTEVGKRSTAEDYEEEDTDDDYAYRNYHLKFGQKVSDRLSYDIGSFIYDKDYDSKDSLDNISRIFKTNWSYYMRKLKEESLEVDFYLNYKEKRFENSSSNEYDQITAAPRLSFTKKDIYTINLSAGIYSFDYLEAENKNQFKFFSKVGGKRYFLDKKLMLTSSYRIEQLEKKIINGDRTKQEVMGGFDYLFDSPCLYKITARAGYGQRDTKEDDDRDEDYDYKYWQYYARTEHRINPKLRTNIKYQYFKKDYVSADLDHRGFYIRNGWRYEILNDEKQRVWFDFDVEHKEVKYILKSNNYYKKETVEIKANYQQKKNWKVSAGLEGNSYNYSRSSGIPQKAGNDSRNDKKRYYAKLSGEKLFLDRDLVLSIDLKYRYTDTEQENDKEQKAVRAAFKYRF